MSKTNEDDGMCDGGPDCQCYCEECGEYLEECGCGPDYAEMERLMDLDPAEGTPEAARLTALAEHAEAYESRRWPLPPLPE